MKTAPELQSEARSNHDAAARALRMARGLKIPGASGEAGGSECSAFHHHATRVQRKPEATETQPVHFDIPTSMDPGSNREVQQLWKTRENPEASIAKRIATLQGGVVATGSDSRDDSVVPCFAANQTATRDGGGVAAHSTGIADLAVSHS